MHKVRSSVFAGNHDLDKREHDEVVKAFGMPNAYCYFDKNGFRFIVPDENYCRIDGRDGPYAKGNMRIYEHVCYFDVNSATMYTVCTKHEPTACLARSFTKCTGLHLVLCAKV